MRGFVVYESLFGNTALIAQAVVDGLKEHLDVETHSVAEGKLPEGADLLVIGGPTHAFSMSRTTTRQDAVNQGAKRRSHHRPARVAGGAARGKRHPVCGVRHAGRHGAPAAWVGREGSREDGSQARLSATHAARELLCPGCAGPAARRGGAARRGVGCAARRVAGRRAEGLGLTKRSWAREVMGLEPCVRHRLSCIFGVTGHSPGLLRWRKAPRQGSVRDRSRSS